MSYCKKYPRNKEYKIKNHNLINFKPSRNYAMSSIFLAPKCDTLPLPEFENDPDGLFSINNDKILEQKKYMISGKDVIT